MCCFCCSWAFLCFSWRCSRVDDSTGCCQCPLPIDRRLSPRALDVDVDDPHTGRASMVAIAKAAGVKTPFVTYDQVRTYAPVCLLVCISKVPGMLHRPMSSVRHAPCPNILISLLMGYITAPVNRRISSLEGMVSTIVPPGTTFQPFETPSAAARLQYQAMRRGSKIERRWILAGVHPHATGNASPGAFLCPYYLPPTQESVLDHADTQESVLDHADFSARTFEDTAACDGHVPSHGKCGVRPLRVA